MILRERVFTVVSVRRNPFPNIRYLRLFHLLDPELHYLYSEHPWVRWCQRKLLRWPTLAWRFHRLERRGGIFWATDWRHLRYVRSCPIVLDLDDPTFASAETSAIRKAPNLVHLVVTTEALRRRFQAAEITCPVAVIPNGFIPLAPELQGVSARERWARERWVPLFGAEALQAIRVIYSATLIPWEDIRLANEAAGRLPPDPAHTCWLFIGRAQGFDPARLRRRNVAFLDIMSHEQLQGYLVGAHVGLYPRTRDSGGRMSIKLVEYSAFGLAILGVHSSETEQLMAAGAMAAAPPEQFCQMVAEHLQNRERLATLATRARALTADLEWPRLAQRYAELFASIPLNLDLGQGGRL